MAVGRQTWCGRSSPELYLLISRQTLDLVWAFDISKSTPSDTIPPRPHLLILLDIQIFKPTWALIQTTTDVNADFCFRV